MDKILIVEDEKSMRDVLGIMLKKEGYNVTLSSSGEEALSLLNKEIFDLVITDIKMPKVDGMQVLKAVKELSDDTLVIMITAFASTETAVEAIKQGAYDYITKPFKIEEMRLIVKNALEKRKLREENILLKRELKEKAVFENIIGKSDKMIKLLDLLRRIADSKSTVLVTGESGTGKELIARAIHYNSKRKDKPFVTVNCGALPEHLLESELFGHMKGSFTGAVANKEGLFEVANEGTIFLDEIGETTPSFQVKLLRVLQDKEFKRVGGTKDIKVDVRIIAATNKDLERAVSEGLFREDLYYRLDVIPINIPPLRERPEDIPLLAEGFLSRYNKIFGKNIEGIDTKAMELLINYEWRGNVRELENVIERAVVLSTEKIMMPEHLKDSLHIRGIQKRLLLPPHIPSDGIDLEGIINEIEKDLLIKALEKARGIKKEAARLLKLNFRSFRYRLEKYKIGKESENTFQQDQDQELEESVPDPTINLHGNSPS